MSHPHTSIISLAHTCLIAPDLLPPTPGQIISASLHKTLAYLNGRMLSRFSCRSHEENTQHNNHEIFILFYFFLCLEIAGSIFFISHITWHDAPKFYSVYRNTLIEHKNSQWIHDWRFAHCTYNSEWQIFFLFPQVLSLTLIALQIISI